MARRKKRMKLPNGFGSIKYLGAGRRNPYAVYPPVQEWTRTGPVSPKNSTKAAFKNCQPLHDKKMGEICYEDLQNVVNSCTLKHSSLELIVSLMHQMYKYAMKYEIVEKDYSAFLYIPILDDDETGVPFSEDELSTLWHNRDNDVVQIILIMCYSGFRIKAYTNMEVNLKEQYFKGGVKTSSSKDRSQIFCF